MTIIFMLMTCNGSKVNDKSMKKLLEYLTLFILILIAETAQSQIPDHKLIDEAKAVPLNLNSESSIEEKKSQVLNFLHIISGKKTLAGQHNERFDSVHPFERSEAIYRLTGKNPALFGIDFSYDYRINGRWSMIYEAVRQWQKGAVINVMWHASIPTLAEPCLRKEGIETKMPDSLWQELITDGSVLNLKLKKRFDEIVVYLAYLQSKGVIVMWRPWHEMNQGAFWWGGRPGPNGTRKLYQITHDYFVKLNGLKNLIWVWDVQDLSWDFQDYDPGDKYWDILALDFYSNDMYTKEKYEAIRIVSGSKPIAIGECGTLPTPEILNEQPCWSFFMAWSDLVFKKNEEEHIIELYNDPRVITLDKMPGWNIMDQK